MNKFNLTLISLTVVLIFAVKFSYGQHEHNGTDTLKINNTKDVVCEMEVEKNDSLKVIYNGKDYFFCSVKDMLIFLKQPQMYTDTQSQNHTEHKTEEHNHGMMGMSTPMIIMGAVMIAVMATAMIIGMTGSTK